MKQRNALLGLTLAGLGLASSPAAAQTTPAARYQTEIVTAVRRDYPALRACYEGARPEARAAWQRLRTATVVVNADGTVGAVTLSPGPGAPGVESCMRPIVQSWRLTAPPGGAPLTLTYSRAQIQRAAHATRR